MPARHKDRHDVGRVLLGTRLREVRLSKGLTLAQLGELTGFRKSHLSEIEIGNNLPSLGALDTIGRALDTTARELLKGIYPWDDVDQPTHQQTHAHRAERQP